MSSAPYQALPSDDYDEERSPVRQRHTTEHHQLAQDPRFNPPAPAWWKRASVVLVIVLLFWLYFSLRASMQRGAEPEVVHAHRYSKQHKFRPAASPVITERLKDGRVRVRGEAPHRRSL